MIPVSVLITTYNEAENMPRCLDALKDFDDVVVIDSNSSDETQQIAMKHGARVENFSWNGDYPKKRQWCLDHIKTKNDYIFFLDADEIVTSDFVKALKKLKFDCAGYFVKGQYVWQGKPLFYGLQNQKLALFDRHKIEFPVIDDLDIEGMGEMEGHYQPILKAKHKNKLLGMIPPPIIHDAYKDEAGWEARHKRYAHWEAQMIKRGAYPDEVSRERKLMKAIFRQLPMRGVIAFMHCYVFKLGLLDGRAGFEFACSRMRYYQMVGKAFKSAHE